VREVNSLWSRNGYKAEVVDIRNETPDVKTFQLRPGSGWEGFKAGQYVNVCIEVNGLRLRRCYSITSDPSVKDTFSITVKRVDGGRVSGWMHDRIRIGDIIELGYPTGDFTVEDGDEKLLFVMGGSGVTPGIGIMKDLHGRGLKRDIVFIQACKTRQDILFKEELDGFCRDNPRLRVVYYVESEVGLLNQQVISNLIPDLKARKAYMCGPIPMMESLKPLWDGLGDLLKTEVYVNSFVVKGERQGTVDVTLGSSGKVIQVKRGIPLLDGLEAAGVDYPYGCRMGVCNTCSCVKVSGETEKITNGEVSCEANVRIKPCVTVANSNIEIDA